MNAFTQNPALDQNVCRELLEANRFGRLAASLADGLVVVPVFYRLDRDRLLLRSATGRELPVGENAVFEVDQTPAANKAGWSVMACGSIARANGTADDIPALEHDEPLLQMAIEQLSGVRIAPFEGGTDHEHQQAWTGRDASDLIG